MADIKPIRYVRNAGNTVGFSELQSGETIAWNDVNHPTFANVATSGSFADLTGNVDINGGTIDGTTIGATTRATGYFNGIYDNSSIQSTSTSDTALNIASGGAHIEKNLTIDGNIVMSTGSITTANVQASGGKIWNTVIGANASGVVDGTTRAGGNFSYVTATANVSTTGNLVASGDVYGTNLHGNLPYSSITGAPAIPDSILDLGISDGTNGQVLTANGNGTFSFTTVTGGSATPGGADTQIQYNNNGSFAGLSTFTTNGSNVTIHNTSITSDNRFDRTDQNWSSGSSGALGTIKVGNVTADTYDVFSNLRNAKLRVEAVATNSGTFTQGVRRQAIAAGSSLDLAANLNVTSNNTRFNGINAQTFINTNGFSTSGSVGATTFSGGAINSIATGTGTVAWLTGSTSGAFAHNGATATLTAGSISFLGTQGTGGTVYAGANYVAGWIQAGTTTVTDTSVLYMGAPAGTSEPIGIAGSPNPANQTGTAHFLNCNNNNAVSKLGSLKRYDEVYNSGQTHNGTTYSVDLSAYNNHEITLSANITELTFTGYNTSTTPAPRLTVSTLVFIQDATGGYTVTWPAGTKFSNGITQIDTAANAVSFVSVMIKSGVYYVTISTYSGA